ncbi:MAG: FecR family protein [Gammaproteobacteria bacterium]|nr:FecR family protein [Gammaproteobacteria bacterium]
MPALRAQETAGAVIFATGQVNAERPQPVPLGKGDAVLVDDIVVTGMTGRAQLEMIDGAKIAIRPDSRLQIEEYFFAEAEAAPAAPVAQAANDAGVLNLIKGGFRTITGLIGEAEEEDYEVRTPVGTLGIRGTDYAVLYCLADCLWAPGIAPGQLPEDGLYIVVTIGVVVFQNELIEIEIESGEFVFVPLTDRLPQLMDAPPPVLLDQFDVALQDPAGAPDNQDPATRGFGAVNLAPRREPPSASVALAAGRGGDGSSSSAPGTGGTGIPAQSIRAIDLDGAPVNLTAGVNPPPGDRTIGFVMAPIAGPGSAAGGGPRVNSAAEYTLDSNNELTGFVGPYAGRQAVEDAQFAIGTASNVDSGFDSVTMMRWGRWTGGVVDITLTGGVDASQDLSSQSLHWISGPQLAPPAIPISGTAAYSLVGSTSPTDNQGNTGVLGAASFVADFTNSTVNSLLDLTIAGSQWAASGAGTIGSTDGTVPAHFFSGAYGAVVIDGLTTGSGGFAGFFAAPGAQDPSLPGGAGLNYALQDMQGIQVSGALIFGDPN